MARYLAQLMLAGGQVVARAFTRALREEMQAGAATRAAASEAGKDGTKAVKNDTFTGMSREEALQILNVKESTDVDSYTKNYDFLFKANDKKSGSFYLQSKVYRAKERLDMEFENTQKNSSQSQQNSSDSQT